MQDLLIYNGQTFSVKLWTSAALVLFEERWDGLSECSEASEPFKRYQTEHE